MVIGVLTLGLLTGQLPFARRECECDRATATSAEARPGPPPRRTSSSSRPRRRLPGSIVFVKAGNIWVQTGDGVTQLTDSGGDSMPSWSPDGEYDLLHPRPDGTGRWPVNGVDDVASTLDVPNLMRVKADGSWPSRSAC